MGAYTNKLKLFSLSFRRTTHSAAAECRVQVGSKRTFLKMKLPDSWKDKSLLHYEPFLSVFKGWQIIRGGRASRQAMLESLGKQVLESPDCVGYFWFLVLFRWLMHPVD